MSPLIHESTGKLKALADCREEVLVLLGEGPVVLFPLSGSTGLRNTNVLGFWVPLLLTTETTPWTSPPLKIGIPQSTPGQGTSGKPGDSEIPTQNALHCDAGLQEVVVNLGVVLCFILDLIAHSSKFCLFSPVWP